MLSEEGPWGLKSQRLYYDPIDAELLRYYFDSYFGFDFIVYPNRDLETANCFERFLEKYHSFFNHNILGGQGINNISDRD